MIAPRKVVMPHVDTGFVPGTHERTHFSHMEKRYEGPDDWVRVFVPTALARARQYKPAERVARPSKKAGRRIANKIASATRTGQRMAAKGKR